MRTIALFTLFALASAASDFYLCEVVVPNFCASSSVGVERQAGCMSEPALSLAGSSVSLTDNFNAIVFGDFSGDTSDIEGRIVVRGSGVVEAGYSIGAEVWTEGVGHTDNHIAYAAIFGQDLSFPSGRITPDGSNQFHKASKEDLYVGGKFSTNETDLAERLTSDARSAGAFDSELDAARSFYTQVQNALAAFADNINIKIEYTTATVTCPTNATKYYGSVGTADLATVTSYVFVDCAAENQMVIKVLDDGVNQVNIHSGGMSAADRKPERTVFNILGSGRIIDLASVGHIGVILSPNNNYQQTGGYTQTILIVANVVFSHQINKLNCEKPAPVNTPSPCVSFEESCAGTLFSAPGAALQGDTREYNVISFGDFNAVTGDVEGRVMTRNDFTVGAGYSVGFQLSTSNNMPDRQQDYSLIAGGECTWKSGSLHPDGTFSPHAGQAENAFCGNSFSQDSADDLKSRLGGSCTTAGCLDAIFDAAKGCYDGYAAKLAAIQDNTQHTIAESALVIKCAEMNATAYAVTLTDVEMTQFTYTLLSGCNFNAYWTVNIVGNGDVTFSGDSFPTGHGAVVYNVQGCRTINVQGTAVNGHLLSTCSTLNQTGGVILGKVVVGNVLMSLQVNKEDTCHTATPVDVPVQSNSSSSAVPEGYNFGLVPSDVIQVNNNINLTTGEVVRITAVNNNDTDITYVTVNNNENESVAVAYSAGSKVGTITVASNAGNGAYANEPNAKPSNSSASMVSVSVALIAIIALLL